MTTQRAAAKKPSARPSAATRAAAPKIPAPPPAPTELATRAAPRKPAATSGHAGPANQPGIRRRATAPSERQRRADRIAAILDEHFPAPPVPLDHATPFQLLVAVILSAQCTDARVNLVTPALFGRAPDACAMATMTADEILPLIRTCGLAPGKAKALAAMSRILVEQHEGEVPDDLEALERLPGVGHKTASVVVVQAFGRPAFPVDTHIHRLAGRWQLSRARNVEEVERDLKALFPEARWHLLHLQLIYFGRASCPAKGHVPAACPVCCWAMSASRARAEQTQGVSKPMRRPKSVRAATR